MDMMELLKTKRTYRRFLQKEIPADVVEDILEAARVASCGANRQSLRYVVIDKKADVDEVCSLAKWAAYLPPEQGTPKENERPVLFVAVLQDTGVAGYNDTDAGLALGNMTTAAWAKGVGSCIMAAIDRAKLREMLKLNEGLTIHTIIAFGYPSHKSRIVEVKDGDIKYYLDDNGDYCVPKYAKEDIVSYFSQSIK